MMRGIQPQVSPRRRAGLEAPQLETTVKWDGLVPPEHQAAFGHQVIDPSRRPLMARWRRETLFHPDGGHWCVEGIEGALPADQLSRDGYGYGGPLYGHPPTVTPIAERALFGMLRAAIAAERTQEAWARRFGFASSYLTEVLATDRPFSERLLAAINVRRVSTYVALNAAGDAIDPADPAQILDSLDRDARRTLLWLPADGAPRDRKVRTGEWRPLRPHLQRLRGLRLAEETTAGWAATEAGQAARAALMAHTNKELAS